MYADKLKKLREDVHFSNLPESIHVPSGGDRQTEVIKPIELATLDDLAFAAIGVEAQLDALNSRFYALRRLYRLAREKGALGIHNAVDVVANDKGGV
jgi:hypothetical protein